MMKWMQAAVLPRNNFSKCRVLFFKSYPLIIFLTSQISGLFVSLEACFAQGATKSNIESFGLGPKSSLFVIDLQSGEEVVSFKPEQTLAPASTLKLITSIVALKNLGADFRFKTALYLIPASNNHYSLGIKGGGDPELTTEQVYLISRRLKLLGIKSISNLLLDDSALKDPSLVQGQRAYEAGSSSLSFNFNSIGVQICPNSNITAGKVSIEPLLWEDAVRVLGDVKLVSGTEANLSLSWHQPGLVRVSGTLGKESGCLIRYLSNQSPQKSFANFLKNNLEELEIGSDITISSGSIPTSARSLFEFDSKPLSQLLIGLNHFSTNVSAEQILAAVGSSGPSYDLSRGRGLEELNRFISELGFKSNHIEDGSGLSRNNQLSSKAISAALGFAWKDPLIGPFLQVSLPVLGHSGTLKRRITPKGDYQVFAKSGTLDGVSSLAGYLHLCPPVAFSCKSYAFSIIQNDVAEISSAHRIEEMILEKIASRLSN